MSITDEQIHAIRDRYPGTLGNNQYQSDMRALIEAITERDATIDKLNGRLTLRWNDLPGATSELIEVAPEGMRPLMRQWIEKLAQRDATIAELRKPVRLNSDPDVEDIRADERDDIDAIENDSSLLWAKGWNGASQIYVLVRAYDRIRDEVVRVHKALEQIGQDMHEARAEIAELRGQLETNQMTFRGMEQSKINLLEHIAELRKPVAVERNEAVEEIRHRRYHAEADEQGDGYEWVCSELKADKAKLLAAYDTLAAARDASARDALLAEIGARDAQLRAYPADWRKDSSLETWFPITATILDQLERQRDGLLAEIKGLRERQTADQLQANWQAGTSFQELSQLQFALRDSQERERQLREALKLVLQYLGISDVGLNAEQQALVDSALSASPAPVESEKELTPTHRHYKGGLYRVLTRATHSESYESMVVYQSIDDGCIWVRPLSMFNGQVNGAPRFAALALPQKENDGG